ncbi:MAG: ABC transporter permease [Oscillospiraceae bacterium]|nr:ABC transporter permease [Oscillospiraceae bacterium]
MRKRLKNTTSKLPALLSCAALLGIWQLVTALGIVPRYMLPSPGAVASVFYKDFGLLAENAKVTLLEAFYGLLLGVLLGFVFAVLMDAFSWLYRAFYPLLVITQTIPTVAVAPLLVLWFGYEMTPKIILIIVVTFFPVTVGLLDGFKAVDPDSVNLLRAMGAGRLKIFRHIKFPSALTPFFSGLRIAAAYSVVGAVISEWLGGFGGLGVYMTRVKKAFAFDKMFAVIILISVISLLLMWLVGFLEKKSMPYKYLHEKE